MDFPEDFCTIYIKHSDQTTVSSDWSISEAVRASWSSITWHSRPVATYLPLFLDMPPGVQRVTAGGNTGKRHCLRQRGTDISNDQSAAGSDVISDGEKNAEVTGIYGYRKQSGTVVVTLRRRNPSFPPRGRFLVKNQTCPTWWTNNCSGSPLFPGSVHPLQQINVICPVSLRMQMLLALGNGGRQHVRRDLQPAAVPSRSPAPPEGTPFIYLQSALISAPGVSVDKRYRTTTGPAAGSLAKPAENTHIN